MDVVKLFHLCCGLNNLYSLIILCIPFVSISLVPLSLLILYFSVFLFLGLATSFAYFVNQNTGFWFIKLHLLFFLCSASTIFACHLITCLFLLFFFFETALFSFFPGILNWGLIHCLHFLSWLLSLFIYLDFSLVILLPMSHWFW